MDIKKQSKSNGGLLIDFMSFIIFLLWEYYIMIFLLNLCVFICFIYTVCVKVCFGSLRKACSVMCLNSIQVVSVDKKTTAEGFYKPKATEV